MESQWLWLHQIGSIWSYLLHRWRNIVTGVASLLSRVNDRVMRYHENHFGRKNDDLFIPSQFHHVEPSYVTPTILNMTFDFHVDAYHSVFASHFLAFLLVFHDALASARTFWILFLGFCAGKLSRVSPLWTSVSFDEKRRNANKNKTQSRPARAKRNSPNK